MRYFNGKPLELLAPAGNFEIFETVVKTGCDAIYFGGQQLNMRMIRKGFNFSNEELKEAIDMAHSAGKLAYITVNNLLDTKEINVARDYLAYLETIQPDALIVQDFAIIELIREMGLHLPVHASVMMNVHNLPMIQALKKQGVSRVVLSRETTLAEVQYLKSHTDVELEYFTHGDMCIAHGAQCYYSSMIFGMSSNRGKCLKPCRWNFNDSYPLAVKDLCLYPYLPEMIQAGVTSFKLEGRMREKEFISQLIGYYADAFDRYIEDPVSFNRWKSYPEIVDKRKRDLSTAYAFGNPGKDNINTRWEGTGKFYSTGKMFSTPTEELDITNEQTTALEKVLSVRSTEVGSPKLAVRVNNMEQAEAVLELSVDRLYLAADVYLPDPAFSLTDIKALSERRGKTELYVCTPRMMNALHFDQYSAWLPKAKSYVQGILVSNLGAIEAFGGLGLNMAGDYSLNVYNGLSAEFYKRQGLKTLTPSLELFGEDLAQLIESTSDLELVVQGPLPAMYLEHDLFKAMGWPEDQPGMLENEAGRFPVYKDVSGRNHVFGTHQLTLLPLAETLKKSPLAFVRIEGQIESAASLKNLIQLYQQALVGQANGEVLYHKLQNTTTHSYAYGALKF